MVKGSIEERNIHANSANPEGFGCNLCRLDLCCGDSVSLVVHVFPVVYLFPVGCISFAG
ncbi:hypothetical protein [Bartonella koehlerae]|uniref:hypothetical protein n=1 Tax=Bartonella koehlerae TaxID=92181 RepID=UPI0012B57F80|nr:hypothetical protein [Bartonella koehlerae]